MIILLGFSLLVLLAYSQEKQYAKDTEDAEQLVTDKLKHLETLGVVNYLYLFSNGGGIIIIYELNGKIKGARCQYRRIPGTGFHNFRLTKESKLNYAKCIDWIKKDTTINFSNCNDFVHSFSRVTFSINNSKHKVNGHFTSDCGDMLKKIYLYELYGIYGIL